MAALLAPFDSSLNTNRNNSDNADDTMAEAEGDPIAAVQSNLITRNGEVERELERMRLLLARVAGRIAQLPPPNANNGVDEEESMDLNALEQKKVKSLLDRL